MLHLLFRLGHETFALPAMDIEAVLALPELETLDHAPAHLAGLMRYRGQFVPVLDISLLHGGAPAPSVISTRIILVRPAPDAPLLGLIVEQAMEMLNLEVRQTLAPEWVGRNDWLAPEVFDTELGLVRAVNWRALLTPEIQGLAAQA